jgi:hypothetical protein
MRRLVILALLLVTASSPAAAAGPSPEASSSAVAPRGPTATELAVEHVRAWDPRFAELVDFGKVVQQFNVGDRTPYVAGSWIHSLATPGTFTERFDSLRWLDIGVRIVQVMLVTGCPAELDLGTLGEEDPCDWRHTWLFHVFPSGEVVPVYDEGDPDDAWPGFDEPSSSPSPSAP